MAQDKVMRVIMDMIGQEKVAALTAELKKEETVLIDLSTQLRTNVISQQQFDAAAQISANKAVQLTTELTKLRGTTGVGGQGIMGASYAFQDFSSVIAMGGENALPRAMMSISNNVDAIGRAFGLSIAQVAGLSAAFTGLTLTMPILIPIFKDVWNSITGGSEDAAKRIEDLAKRTKDAIKEFNEAVEKPEEPEEIRAKRIADLMPGEKARQIQDALIKSMVATGTGFVDIAEEYVDPKRAPHIAALKRQEHEERVKAGNLAEAQRILGAATKGKTRQEREEALLRIRGLAGDRPEFFPTGFAADIEQPPPTREEQTKIELEARRNIRKGEKEADQEAKREAAHRKEDAADVADSIRESFMSRDRNERDIAAEQKRADAAKKREAAEVERARKEAAMDDVTPAAAALNYAERMVTAYSEQAGTGTPSPEQAKRMGQNALNNVVAGMNELQATAAAWTTQMLEMERATQDFYDRTQQLSGQVQPSRRRPTPTASTAGWGG